MDILGKNFAVSEKIQGSGDIGMKRVEKRLVKNMQKRDRGLEPLPAEFLSPFHGMPIILMTGA